jgi:hypothetical protein
MRVHWRASGLPNLGKALTRGLTKLGEELLSPLRIIAGNHHCAHCLEEKSHKELHINMV